MPLLLLPLSLLLSLSLLLLLGFKNAFSVLKLIFFLFAGEPFSSNFLLKEKQKNGWR